MAEYYIKRKSANQVDVAKFGDSAEAPESQYTVDTELKEGIEIPVRCVCPKWQTRRNTTFCRHTEMVQEFLTRGGEPVVLIKE